MADSAPPAAAAPPAAPPAAEASNPASDFLARAKAMLPDVSDLYLQPLDPSSELSPGDRVSLVWQSARPWGEFLDFSAFNRPTFEEASTRVSDNVRTYFYNYFLLACVHVLFFSLGHLGTLLFVLGWLGVMYFLHVHHPDDIDIAGKVTLDDRGKLVVAVLAGLVVIFFGHALTLLISLAVFLLIVVGVHSIIRDNTMDVIEPAI